VLVAACSQFHLAALLPLMAVHMLAVGLAGEGRWRRLGVFALGFVPTFAVLQLLGGVEQVEVGPFLRSVGGYAARERAPLPELLPPLDVLALAGLFVVGIPWIRSWRASQDGGLDIPRFAALWVLVSCGLIFVELAIAPVRAVDSEIYGWGNPGRAILTVVTLRWAASLLLRGPRARQLGLAALVLLGPVAVLAVSATWTRHAVDVWTDEWRALSDPDWPEPWTYETWDHSFDIHHLMPTMRAFASKADPTQAVLFTGYCSQSMTALTAWHRRATGDASTKPMVGFGARDPRSWTLVVPDSLDLAPAGVGTTYSSRSMVAIPGCRLLDVSQIGDGRQAYALDLVGRLGEAPILLSVGTWKSQTVLERAELVTSGGVVESVSSTDQSDERAGYSVWWVFDPSSMADARQARFELYGDELDQPQFIVARMPRASSP